MLHFPKYQKHEVKMFKDLTNSQEILKAIEILEYKNPTDVQSKVIPLIKLGEDLIVKSQTGSGKTAAFLIPIIENISWDNKSPSVLVLVPTRELAMQVKEDAMNLGRFKRIRAAALFGKQPFKYQITELRQLNHILVGTPGRVLDHIKRDNLDIGSINTLVIDEADELFNMGFMEDMNKIIRKINKKRQTLMFSATIPDEVKSLIQNTMYKPQMIDIIPSYNVLDNVDAKAYILDSVDKRKALHRVLLLEMAQSGVIFCSKKETVDSIYEFLKEKSYSVMRIHGGLEQEERFENMKKFKKGGFRYLVATDVVARGIDIDRLEVIINYDIPMEKEAYIHRMGRTARAGNKGKAITFVTRNELDFLSGIEYFIGRDIQKQDFVFEEIDTIELKEKKKILKENPHKKILKSEKLNLEIMKLYIGGGRDKKLRKVDLVGTILKINGIEMKDVGIITILDSISYVDILNGKGEIVLSALQNMTIKGKKVKIQKAKVIE
jgi:superfamily II DNA/RNA helicase